jgi:SsrA-binding protein
MPGSSRVNQRGIAKVSLALCRGKTDSDKRETLKKREATREMEREMRRK